MTTFNFTVRATDNLGAYADRDFSIDVRNTVVERFVMVGATDAASSNDGINWTVRPGAGGQHVVNVLGRWWVFPLTIGGLAGTTTTFKYSSDAINWSSGSLPTANNILASLPVAVGSTTYIITRNVSNNGSGQWHPVLYSTTDAVNWTLISTLDNYVAYASTGDGGYLPAYDGSKMVFLRAKLSKTATEFGMYSTNGGVNFTLLNSSNTNLPSGEYFTDFKYINGLWVAASGTTNKMWISTDLAFWSSYTSGFAPTPTSSQPQFVYGNGRLAMSSSGATATSTSVYTSETGKLWTNRTAGGFGNTSSPGIAFNNGVFVFPIVGHVPYYSNDGITWTAGNLPASGIGMVAGLSQG